MFVDAVAQPPTSSTRTPAPQRPGRQRGVRGILAWASRRPTPPTSTRYGPAPSKQMPDNLTDDSVDDRRAVTHSAHLGMAIKMGKQFERQAALRQQYRLALLGREALRTGRQRAARRAVHSVINRDRRIVKLLHLADEEEEKRLRQIARYETASAITGILTEAAALEVFSVEVGDLDADPWLFNCANGTLDLRTMELRDHDPADRITKVANAAYRPDAGAGTEWIAVSGKGAARQGRPRLHPAAHQSVAARRSQRRQANRPDHDRQWSQRQDHFHRSDVLHLG